MNNYNLLKAVWVYFLPWVFQSFYLSQVQQKILGRNTPPLNLSSRPKKYHDKNVKTYPDFPLAWSVSKLRFLKKTVLFSATSCPALGQDLDLNLESPSSSSLSPSKSDES